MIKSTPTDFFAEGLKLSSIEEIRDTLNNIIEIPKTVVSISIRKCFLRSIPTDFFMKFEKLESLDLYANSIEIFDFNIPQNVRTINLSYNRLEEITIQLFQQIEYINLSYNFFKSVPQQLGNIRYTIDHNDFPEVFVKREYINDAHARINNIQLIFANAINNAIINNQIQEENDNNANAPNVHETDIQRNTRKSINYLVESRKEIPKEDNYIKDLYYAYKDLIIKQEKRPLKRLLYLLGISSRLNDMNMMLNHYDSYGNDIVYEYYPYKTCKMSDILERIWVHAKNNTNHDSIMENLYIQMEDGMPHCFTGKYTRLVNTLSAFINNVHMEIPINIRISDKIVEMRNKNIPIETIKTKMKEYMTEQGLSEEDQEPWIEALE